MTEPTPTRCLRDILATRYELSGIPLEKKATWSTITVDSRLIVSPGEVVRIGQVVCVRDPEQPDAEPDVFVVE